jgi:hypothetical protein
MGKGGSTPQDNVAKRRSALTSDKAELLAKAGMAAGGTGFDKTRQINQCMIRFTVQVVDNTEALKLGDSVTLIPEGSAGVQLIHQGRKIASYEGDLAATLFECMKLGYIYKGEVIELANQHVVTCRIQGSGKL